MSQQPELRAEAQQWPLEKQIEFHLKEYEHLKSEIARLDTAKRTLQLYTVGAVAAVIAWLVTNRQAIDPIERFAWWLPLYVAVTGAMLSRAYVRAAYGIGAYLKKLEEVAAHPGLGWERTLAERRRIAGPLITRRETIAWIMVLAISAALALSLGLPPQVFDLVREMRPWR